MACFYSLIQYVPDVLAEERITFGVVVYWQRGVASRFVKNWGRIRAVAGGGDIDFLRGFAGRFESEFVSRTYIDIPDAGPLGETLIHKLSRDWHHSIQLTRPRASMAAPQRLIDQLSERALGSAWRQPRRASKASIIDDATALLRNELTAQTGRDFYDAVRTSEHLNGKVERHGFDITIANGRPLAAAQVLSVPLTGQLNSKVIGDLAWALRDVRDTSPIPMSVLLSTPAPAGQAIIRIRKIADAVGADVISRLELGSWAKRAATQAAQSLLSH